MIDEGALISDDDAVAASPAGAVAPREAAGSARGILKPALLLLALLVVYGPALDGSFLWDDADNITKSVPLRAPGGLARIWLEPGATQQYFPALHTLWWCEYRLFGENPRGYHVVNLLLHAAAAALLARVLTQLRIPASWFAAAIFALHPLCVESVAWITEGKNTLSLCLTLASLSAYLRFEGFGAEDASVPTQRYGWYATSLTLYTLALLSKTNAATLPGVILVLLAWRRGRLTPRDFLHAAPLIAVGAAVATVVVRVESGLIGSAQAEFAWPWTERVLVAGRACWFYLGKILFPYPLTFIYPRWQIDPHDAMQWIYPVAAAALPVALWFLRPRLGGAPLATVLIFGGTLLPQLGLVPLYGQIFSYVADHWAYLSAVAPITLVASLSATQAERRLPRRVAYAGGCVLLAVLGVLTHRQAQNYRDETALWTDTLAGNPDCWLAHHNLALQQLEADDFPSAAAGLARALELRPQFKEAYNNRALVAVKQGRRQDAAGDFRRALEIDPRFADAHVNLALLLIEQQAWDEAARHLQAALERNPDYPQARAALGLLLARTGRVDEGLAELRTAIARDPRDAKALVNLGTILAGSGRLDEAQAALEQALQIDPELADAYAGIGNLFMARGDAANAESAYRASLEINPRSADVQFNFGNALVRRKQNDAAIDAYRRALLLSPDHIPAHLNLAAVLLAQRKMEEARVQIDAVLAARPDHPQALALKSKLPKSGGPR